MNRFKKNKPLIGQENEKEEKEHKYLAQKTEVLGVKFDSKAEGAFFAYMVNVLGIPKDNIILQPKFTLQEKFDSPVYGHIRAIEYRSDFQFGGVVFDVKGVETKDFVMKKKIFAKKYPHLILVLVKRKGKRFIFYKLNENIKMVTSIGDLITVGGDK